MKRLSIRTAVAAAAVSLAVLPARRAAAQVVYQDNFDASQPTWAAVPNTPGDGTGMTTEQHASGTSSYKLGPGYAYVFPIPTGGRGYFTTSFDALNPWGNTWFSYGVSSSGFLQPGGGWTFNSMPGREENSTYNDTFFFSNNGTVPVYLDNVKVTKITDAEAAQQFRDFYATMPAYNFVPPANRQQHIDRFMSLVKGGKSANVVMLGDSIVADTSRSGFETQVEQMYPGSKINVTTSVRGSTGCWYYKDDNRVQSYVLDYNPDLVLIGGISHQNDIDSIRSVIQQIRAGNPTTDIALMTEASDVNNDPFTHPEIMDPVDPTGSDWSAQLYRLSKEMNTGFIDLRSVWGNYIYNSGEPYTYFERDPVHMNDHGNAVVGQAMAAYFAPVPEPASLGVLAVIGGMTALRRRRK
jgi:hypothetical protein